MTAIFVANDHMAMGVLRALAEAGRRVPDDVSVFGYDDVPEAEFQMVPLSTVAIDAEEAAERILSRAGRHDRGQRAGGRADRAVLPSWSSAPRPDRPRPVGRPATDP